MSIWSYSVFDIYICIECSFFTDDHRKGSPWIQMYNIDREFVWEKPDQARWLMPNVHVDAKSTVCTHKNNKQPTPYWSWGDEKIWNVYTYISLLTWFFCDLVIILRFSLLGIWCAKHLRSSAEGKQPFFFGWGGGVPSGSSVKWSLMGIPYWKL